MLQEGQVEGGAAVIHKLPRSMFEEHMVQFAGDYPVSEISFIHILAVTIQLPEQ